MRGVYADFEIWCLIWRLPPLSCSSRSPSVAPGAILPRPFPLRQRHGNVFVNRGTGIDAVTRI